MPMRQLAAALAAVATGASGEIDTRDVRDVFTTWKCESLSFVFTPPPGDTSIFEKKKKKKMIIRPFVMQLFCRFKNGPFLQS